jgi:hypothetical protein
MSKYYDGLATLIAWVSMMSKSWRQKIDRKGREDFRGKY